ncbi:hypothetical protein ANCDUO_09031 [Ancylostoma duodenale]|uniref:Receptor ligand binding region domain-containing protein n=1 Tax=Ancylostoma duodenale TaxID=51022 RepID=A0A0C2GNP1_9BILA|nr:hypothetical protein ANCDUO_09031 [Ancylostoma duodenale]
MSDDSDPGSSVNNFTSLVSQKMMESPIKCTQCTEERGWKMAQYADQLHDAMIIYATVVNKTLEANRNIRDGDFMFDETAATYEGALGNVTIASDGARIPSFIFSGLGSDGPKKLAVIDMDKEGLNATLVTLYSPEQEKDVVWNGRTCPSTVPPCGYTGINRRLCH